MTNEPNDPAAPPGEDVKDVPEATLEVDNDATSVRFEDPSPEEPQNAAPQDNRRRSVLVKGFSAMGLSTIARRFDRQGKGELDEAEQRARDLADTEGHVRPDQAITAMELGMANEKKLNKTVRHFRLMSVLALLLLVGLFVAVFYAPDNAVAKGNAEVKEKIDESVQTDVAVDALGDPHLTDKATGKDITVKADGVVAGTTPRVLNGRKLTCISLADVASAVHGLETASTKVNLVFRDEEGLGTKITPLSDYEDKQSYLSFDGGGIKVRMDSDACDAAASLGNGDAEGVRRLGEATTSTSLPGPETNAIRAKLRQAFVSSWKALRDGRRLTGGAEAEIIDEGTRTCLGLGLDTDRGVLSFQNKAQLQAAVDAHIHQQDPATFHGDFFWYDFWNGKVYGPIEGWDVSRVTDMSNLFKSQASFNDDISRWDTSSVTDMTGMFSYTSAFNQDISGWDTSNVRNMQGMFGAASAFDQDLSSWDMSSVTDMSNMFFNANAFNQNLCPWRNRFGPEKDYTNMFGNSNCPSTSEPVGRCANWCRATCWCPST